MKALRQYGGKDMRLEDIPEPEPGPEEVKIKVKWCGICGSDVHEYQGLPGLLPVKKPHPGTGKMVPITGGHEFSGQVVKIGKSVTHINIGDRVTVRATLPCYKCRYCKKGKHTQCVIIGAIGSAADGAFAEYVVVPGDTVYPLPNEVTYEMGAFTEPLACAVHAVKRSHMEPGATVCIIGAGPIGLFTMQVAMACGAGKVIVFEMLPKRSQLAKELGATEVIHPNEVNPGKAIAALTEGWKADIVFECAGPSEAMLMAERVCGRDGAIVEVGVMLTPCHFPFSSLQMREKTIITSLTYVVDEFPVAISFLANRKVKCDPVMISAKIKLGDILEKGFKELLSERRLDHCKILVSPE
jgi:(R,R)-butanediol dehydrogenase / meso-butanediol dehydrogenase / diacetyl reductase